MPVGRERPRRPRGRLRRGDREGRRRPRRPPHPRLRRGQPLGAHRRRAAERARLQATSPRSSAARSSGASSGIPSRERSRSATRRPRHTWKARRTRPDGHHRDASSRSRSGSRRSTPAEALEELKRRCGRPDRHPDAINREEIRSRRRHIDGDGELSRPADEFARPCRGGRPGPVATAGDPLLRLRQSLRPRRRRAAASTASTTPRRFAGGIDAWEAEGLPVVIPEGMSPEQRNRYSRHTLLPEVGVEGQLKMLNAKVLLVGAGGLGAPVGALPGRRRDRHARPGRRRRGRRVEPAAPGDPQHRAGRPAQDGVGAQDDRGAQPRRQGGRAPHAARRHQHHRHHLATTT